MSVPVFDVDDTVRVSDHSPLAAAGHTGIVAEVDPAATDTEDTLYLVTLTAPDAPTCAGGWWVPELEVFPHDCDQEDDGA